MASGSSSITKGIENIPIMAKFRQADGIDYALRVLQRDIHFKYEKANDEEIIYIN